MHRQIKFVMIPDGSSSAPAYSLWKNQNPNKTKQSKQILPPFPIVSPHVVTNPSVCLCCVSRLHLLTWPHLTAFLLLHLHRASGSLCCGAAGAWQPTQLSGGAGKLQCNPSGASHCSCAGCHCWLSLGSGRAVPVSPGYLAALCLLVALHWPSSRTSLVGTHTRLSH